MKPEDIADLKQLIEFLKENQVAEFDLDRGELKIRLKFNPAEAASTSLGDLGRLLGSAPAPVGRAAAAATQPVTLETPVSAPVEPESGLHTVKSPMVGTFFGSPSPGAAQFVSVGDRVTKGQVIGIVEAMKLMNEIESDAAGEVVKCLVTNGQPIEYGQPLFAVRIT
jgi:acetyl-CoA carboxylase biotin carboxyl carrier protein